MVKNIIPKLGMSFYQCKKILDCSAVSFISSPFCTVFSSLTLSVFLLSIVSGRAGYQPSPATDGAISVGDRLGGHVVPLQPRVPA